MNTPRAADTETMKTQVTPNVDNAAENDDDDDDDNAAVSELITRILLEHFGDGVPVHADIVMDTVQYRLARDDAVEKALERQRSQENNSNSTIEDEDSECYHYYNADDQWRQHEYYCMWADPRVSRAYHRCLLLLVRSDRVRVVYDCAGGCGGYREDGRDRRHCNNGCEGVGVHGMMLARRPAHHLKTTTTTATTRRYKPARGNGRCRS